MISVIIPMYNSKGTIIRTLDSIKKQTAINEIGEIIVVNDGSTDDSLEIVKKYCEDNRQMPIKIIDKQNGGVSSARNAGLRIAKEDYIALLDSDDEWLPEKTKIQLDVLKSHPEIDFLGCNSDNKNLRILFRRIDSLYKVSLRDLLIKMFPTTPSVIFKKKILVEVGFFDENQKYCEDANYWLRICTKLNFYMIPNSLVVTKGGKPAGSSGLSSNLKEMYGGAFKNLNDLRKQNYLNIFSYSLLYLFYWFKYIRRIVIMNFRKFN